jgi:hypothetical protein
MKAISKISIGDYVRYIILSYYELGKSELNDPRFYRLPNEDYSTVMLGGRYLVNNIIRNPWGVLMYELSFMGNVISLLVPEESLKEENNIIVCPYQIGDAVYFHPDHDKKDQEYLLSFFPFKQELLNKDPLIIRKIINEYYVLVSKKDSSIFGFPLLWTDFSIL